MSRVEVKPKDAFEVCKEFFSGLTKMQEAKELLNDVGDRVAQFVIAEGSPFYVQLSKDAVVTVVQGTAKQADIRIETNTTTCEEIFKPLGASFAKFRKDPSKLWTRPCLPWEVAWFGMLVRILQGRD